MTRLSAAELRTYDQACNKIGKLLAKASTLVPETYGDDGVRSRGLRRKLTDDSVERFIKANIDNRRDTLVDNVLTQAFETLYQRQAHARREFIRVPRGMVKVMDANIPAMVAKLKEFGRSARIGDTAKDIVAAQDDLRAFKLTGLKSDTQFSKKIDKTLQMMLVTYNPGGGYQSLEDIRASRASKTNKAAMTAAFKYLAHGLGAVPHNATAEDYENARICVDQRDRAHALIQKLQDPRSDTMKAIMKVRP
jgi:hypothetical protein